ncbi:VWA domain-containing protein [Salegentibacter sp. LM13S]|uniref:vWA domain-containing protein n=1 Tax=Salegentibacter lacus TaxID=2873599 RepID=UPI001CCE67EC|nr:vWA domain-containing protein [Salegentibacter lacus]MBZ9632290.1 VWA domain-containing protein [Salegentibacter lacus]
MEKVIKVFLLFILFIVIGCSEDAINGSDEGPEALRDSYGEASGDGSGEPSAENPNNGNGDPDSSGLITAGEWNDLENWNFWLDLNNNQDFAEKIYHWEFYFNNRVSVSVKNMSALPVIDAIIELKNKQDATVWSAKSDNKGKAELWINPFESSSSFDINDYSLWINDEKINTSLKGIDQGVNELQIKNTNVAPNNVEIAFIVDATGSMSDELEFLKDDLKNIIQKVENSNSNLDILTSSVFYRDVEDEYVVRHSGFSSDINTTLDFINNQSANGGGDFPEAVHTALNRALNELQWSSNARTRLAFLILDAPPHHNQQVISDIQNSIKNAAEKGIKLIPVTASGIDKETEFLMRYFSMATNSTYVFITDHSGIGNDHIEPSIGEYKVEFLNELLIRLIKKYSE